MDGEDESDLLLLAIVVEARLKNMVVRHYCDLFLRGLAQLAKMEGYVS